MADADLAIERAEICGLVTQRSTPESLQVLYLQSEQWHTIWRPRELPDLPQYTSVSDFAGRRELYQGRHSVVWSCRCRATHSHLVLKAYDKKKMNARHHRNAAREIAILESLHEEDPERFPGVVEFLGKFEDHKYIYIVQDQCSQGDLFQQLLKRGGTMEESRVCTDVVVPLLLTLRHLHNRKIVHRDIKPENIFFTKHNELKLGDFGLAIDAGQDTPLSRVGTLDYMAPEVLNMPTPEQIARQGLDISTISGYDDKIDIWALGILVYELLAGRPPFEVEDPDQTALLIMHAHLEIFPPHIGPQCVSFIKQALIKDPEDRASADELLHHPWVRQHFQIVPEPEPMPPVPPPPSVACTAGLRTVPTAWEHPAQKKGENGISNNNWVRGLFSEGLAGIVHIATEGPSPTPSPVILDKHTVHQRLATSMTKNTAKICKPGGNRTRNSQRSASISAVPADALLLPLRASADPRWQSCPGGSISLMSCSSTCSSRGSDDCPLHRAANSAHKSARVLYTSGALTELEASSRSRSKTGSDAAGDEGPTDGTAKQPCPIDAAVLEAWRARCQYTSAPRAPGGSPLATHASHHQPPAQSPPQPPPRNNAPAAYVCPASSPGSSRFGPSRFGASTSSTPSPSRFAAPSGSSPPSRFAS